MNRASFTLTAVSALCLMVLSAAAQAAANDPEIVFDPPLSVTIRQTNGAPARGEILSMTGKELLLKAINGKEVRIKLERVRSIKTSNESFEYWPSDEPFTELCQRVDKVPGATLMGDIARPKTGRSTQRAAPKRSEPADAEEEDSDRPGLKKKPRLALPSADEIEESRPSLKIGSRDRGDDEDAQAEDKTDKRGPTRSRREADEATADDDQGDAPKAGGTVYLCSHCEKELPLAFLSGDACPHCGKIAVFEEESASTAALADAAPNKNPFATGGPATTPAPVHTPVATPAAVAPAPATGGGMTLADVPLAAKIGIFLGFVVIGWFVLNRR
jgi:hypothetical protein